MHFYGTSPKNVQCVREREGGKLFSENLVNRNLSAHPDSKRGSMYAVEELLAQCLNAKKY